MATQTKHTGDAWKIAPARKSQYVIDSGAPSGKLPESFGRGAVVTIGAHRSTEVPSLVVSAGTDTGLPLVAIRTALVAGVIPHAVIVEALADSGYTVEISKTPRA